MKTTGSTITNKRRLVIAFMIFSVIVILLCVRLGYIQIVKGDEYKEKAAEQQTEDEIVEAKRGDITDRNGNKLAVSTVTYSVWARPASIKTEKTDSANEKKIEETASKLAEILDMDKDEIIEDLNKDQALIKIAKYQTNSTVKKIRKAELSGISITEETKRAYPLGNFASQLLGSVTDDNNGLSGLEQYYNQELRGSSGRWVRSKDADGNTLAYGDDTYYEAEEGEQLELTIDETIQHYAEDQIAKTKKSTKADRVRCIVMDPETGEILAMASTGGFDPNNSREGTTESEKKKLADMSAEEQLEYLNKKWRNPLVSDTYEPGSTFKLFTTAMALEENLTKESETFNCSGSINVSGTTIKCWRSYNPHGTENLKEAVSNSCNPVFCELATRVGISKFYDYLGLFGFDEQTGIDYPGEAEAIFQDEDSAGPVGIATIGFGQGIAVTPIQLITGVCALGNDGKLMQPHLVKAIKDKNGKTVEEIEPKVVRQAVSKETADTMKDIMENVVSGEGGGAKQARISGYRVGGKTGTANKVDSETGEYGDEIIASFVGMAPMDDPQICILYIVDDPKGEVFGSTVAAPEAQKVMKNTLRYLKVEKSE